MRVELDLKKIKSSDLEAINKDINVREIFTIQSLNKILNKRIIGYGENSIYIKMVYLFKLGVMLGKREEREKKKSKGGKYGKNNIKL